MILDHVTRYHVIKQRYTSLTGPVYKLEQLGGLLPSRVRQNPPVTGRGGGGEPIRARGHSPRDPPQSFGGEIRELD